MLVALEVPAQQVQQVILAHLVILALALLLAAQDHPVLLVWQVM
jgi:hypothetical protein